MKKLILLLLLTFVFVSCSEKNLDRGKAENLITEFYEYPNVEFLDVSIVSMGRNVPAYYSQLVNDGYFTFKNEQWRALFFMTKNAKPYLKKKYGETYTFFSNEIHFKEITGIKFNDAKTNATVYYKTIRQNLTPVAKSYGRSDSDIEEKEVHFELFDDGWRIRDKKPEEISKPADYNVFNKDFVEQLEKETKYLGKWKSVEMIGECNDIIELYRNEENIISASLYSECDDAGSFSVSNGKITNDLLIFEGDAVFGGLELALTNGYLIDNSSADKFKYSRIE